MDPVRLPPAAEALFRAHQDRSTGWLTLVCHGREAKLYLQHGDLVGARLGFGHQTDAQALLAAGLLPLPALDGLWARGELSDPARVCEAAGADPGGMAECRALASVRRVTELADEASFMPALVEVSLPRVRGARAVRAAFGTLPPVPAEARVRCTNLTAAEPFLTTPEERTFLGSFEEFRPLDSVTPSQSALLRALEHAGWVEILDAAAWEQRVGAEAAEAARRAEEGGRRAAARLALEAARSAEEQRQAELRRRAEAAQRALEAARAAEAAWRQTQAVVPPEEALADTLRSRAPALSTEREFPAPEEPELPFAAADLGDSDVRFAPPDELQVPLLTTATPQPGPIPARPEVTERMGEPDQASREDHPWADQSDSVGDEDTLVRAARSATGQTDPYASLPIATEASSVPTAAGTRRPTDPYAPMSIVAEASPGPTAAGAPRVTDPYAPRLPAPESAADLPAAGARRPTDPYAQGLANEPGHTDPYAQALPRAPDAAAEEDRPWFSEAPTPPEGIPLQDEPILEAEALLVPEGDEPVLFPPAPEPASALVAELSEALRRAGSDAPPDLWSARSTEAVGSRPAERAPLRLGPEGEPGEDADLWKLVGGPPSQAPASFEDALRQVDTQLESLAGLRRDAAAGPGPLGLSALDALVRTSFGSDSWTLEPPLDSPSTVDPSISGPFPLANLSQTPLPSEPPALPDPPELSAERRQALLRQARHAADAEPAGPHLGTPLPRSLEDAELIEAIEARHAALGRDVDRFAVLGLPPDSSRDEVKRAFIELAKRFHPDRLPRSLAVFAPKAARVFDAIREAQEFLLDDVRRSKHAKTHALPADSPPRDPAAAAEALVAGEMAMRKRDYAQAEVHFEQAQALDPRPSTLAARAWSIYMDPSRKSEAGRARAMMVDALKADPDCDRAHYQLGVIARVEGAIDRAERHFREAVRANPRHLEAAQELRLLQMRRRPPPRRS
jgi:curved DNA-binding protein CbpA